MVSLCLHEGHVNGDCQYKRYSFQHENTIALISPSRTESVG